MFWTLEPPQDVLGVAQSCEAWTRELRTRSSVEIDWKRSSARRPKEGLESQGQGKDNKMLPETTRHRQQEEEMMKVTRFRAHQCHRRQAPAGQRKKKLLEECG